MGQQWSSDGLPRVVNSNLHERLVISQQTRNRVRDLTKSFLGGFWKKKRKGDRAKILRKTHAKNTGWYFFATFHLGFDLFQSVKQQQLTYTYIELKNNATWFALSWYVPVEESEISLEVDGAFKAALLKHCSCFEWYAWYNNERITISYFVLSMI